MRIGDGGPTEDGHPRVSPWGGDARPMTMGVDKHDESTEHGDDHTDGQ